MDNLKELQRKKFLTKEKTNSRISTKLVSEIKITQKLLTKLYYQEHKKKKKFNIIQASDFVAEIYKRARYKIQNE
jgi:hypothetical protein